MGPKLIRSVARCFTSFVTPSLPADDKGNMRIAVECIIVNFLRQAFAGGFFAADIHQDNGSAFWQCRKQKLRLPFLHWESGSSRTSIFAYPPRRFRYSATASFQNCSLSLPTANMVIRSMVASNRAGVTSLKRNIGTVVIRTVLYRSNKKRACAYPHNT